MKKCSKFFSGKYCLQIKGNLIFNLILLLLLCIIKIKSIQNLKLIYLGEDNYYIISSEKIYFYKNIGNNNKMPILFTFPSDQKIQLEEEFDTIFFGEFDCQIKIRNILIIKNYVYYVLKDEYYCYEQLKKIEGIISEFIPFRCVLLYCYYIVGFISSNQKLNIYIFKKLYNNCLDKSDVFSILSYNTIDSENFSCQLMEDSSDEQVLTCFYQKHNSQLIIATSFKIDFLYQSIEDISSLTSTKQINGAKFIKSKISTDSKKSYVCFINNDNNVDCLIYDINTNTWSDPKNYLNNCLPTLNSLNFEYYEKSNEYFLYCYQSTETLNIIKLDENFNIKNNLNNFCDFTGYLKNNCTNYYLSTLFYNVENVKSLINCDNKFQQKSPNEINQINLIIYTNIFYSTFPISTSLITNLLSTSVFAPNLTSIYLMTSNINLFSTSINNNDNTLIIQGKSDKTKEEIINNLGKDMEDWQKDKIYEIFGNDYTIKISPINMNMYKNISTYIDFLRCEQILREKNELNLSDILTVYQIETNNAYENSLINQIEYAVFNEYKELLDLSICNNETIEISYQINISKIDMSKVNYYSNLGIDIFNIEDQFFNDICFPYSENNSDLILKDRISNIYINYTVCEKNCKYDKINLSTNTIKCKCSVKTKDNSEINAPTLDKIIRDSFLDSNFGVIKCYKLVFSFKNKLKNIGFLIFTVLIILHIPFIIWYFKYNLHPIIKFIFDEMSKYHYFYIHKSPMKKKNNIFDKNTDKKRKKESFQKIKIHNNGKEITNNSRKIIKLKENKIIREKNNSHGNDSIYKNLNNMSYNDFKNYKLLNIKQGNINKKEKKKFA